MVTAPGTLPNTVLHSLTNGTCRTMDDLVSDLGLSRRQVSDGAAKLVLRGYLERVEAGCYRLTAAGLAAAAAGEVIKSGPYRKHTDKAREALPDTFRQRLWTAIRMSGAFTIGDVVMAATRGDKDAESNAGRYLRYLIRAGYVAELPVRQPGTRMTSNGFKRYRLIKNTGQIAPIYRGLTGEIYDYNTGECAPCIN